MSQYNFEDKKSWYRKITEYILGIAALLSIPSYSIHLYEKFTDMNQSKTQLLSLNLKT